MLPFYYRQNGIDHKSNNVLYEKWEFKVNILPSDPWDDKCCQTEISLTIKKKCLNKVISLPPDPLDGKCCQQRYLSQVTTFSQ